MQPQASLFQLILHGNKQHLVLLMRKKTLQEVFPLTGKKKEKQRIYYFKAERAVADDTPIQTKNFPATSFVELLLSLKRSDAFPRHWSHQLTSEKPTVLLSRENWSLRGRSKRNGLMRKDEGTSYAQPLLEDERPSEVHSLEETHLCSPEKKKKKIFFVFKCCIMCVQK